MLNTLFGILFVIGFLALLYIGIKKVIKIEKAKKGL